MAKLIGTAGHVDHGKTTLIQALTGIDADRLPEEKRRGMTIDIGFAYIDLPGHGRVSIVDVPGHRKFLTNMLVGALGIDVALLCVAADESVMPQTKEHVAILELLPVEELVVAITRSDLADEGVREISQLEVAELLKGTRFAGAKVIFTSATTREGLEELKAALDEALGRATAKKEGSWYLPIDRVFSVKGQGCVVTGTLARGAVGIGERAFIAPRDWEVRVRAIHSHDEPIVRAEAGQRTALNLSGVKVDSIKRGMVVGAPGAVFETDVFDGVVKWLVEPKHGNRVRISIGAEEALGRVQINPESNVVQFRLESQVACALDQPFIVRRYSPPDLLGGGTVVVPQAARRKRKDVAVVPTETGGDPILQVLAAHPEGMMTEQVCRSLGKTAQELGDSFERLQAEGKAAGFAGLWFSDATFDFASERFLTALAELHEVAPQVAFQAREKAVAKAGLKWAGKPLDRIVAALDRSGRIEAQGTSVKLAEFKIALTPKQRGLLDRVIGELESSLVSPPPPHEIANRIVVPVQAVEEILKLGRQAGELLGLGDGVWFTNKQVKEIEAKMRALPQPFSASEFRDAFETTRKYAIPLLEHFDAIRLTTRTGDRRAVN